MDDAGTIALSFVLGCFPFALLALRFRRTKNAAMEICEEQSKLIEKQGELLQRQVEALKVAGATATPPWIDISSAPKDGSEILATGFVRDDPQQGRFVALVHWFEDGWYDGTNEDDAHGDEIYPPTHWMPPPTPDFIPAIKGGAS